MNYGCIPRTGGLHKFEENVLCNGDATPPIKRQWRLRLQPKAQAVRAPNQDVVGFCSFRKLRFLLCKRPLDRLSFGATVFQQTRESLHRGTMLRYLHRVFSSGAPDHQNEDSKPVDTWLCGLKLLGGPGNSKRSGLASKDVTMMNNIL